MLVAAWKEVEGDGDSDDKLLWWLIGARNTSGLRVDDMVASRYPFNRLDEALTHSSLLPKSKSSSSCCCVEAHVLWDDGGSVAGSVWLVELDDEVLLDKP